MPVRKSVSFLLVSMCFATICIARDLRVPDEFSMISMALQSMQENDTVTISPGIYVESLVAPGIDFVMCGSVRLDSQATEFAVIDPTDLPGSDSLLTLRLTGGSAKIMDLVFRNRSSMIEGRLQSEESGIMGDTSVRSISFERCIFDSLITAVSRVDLITVRNCRFIGCRGAVYTGFWRGTLTADSTWFDGFGGLVNTQEGCRIEDCLFTHAGPSPILNGVGDSLRIKNCRFVGRGLMSSSALSLRGRCGSILTSCVFEDIEVMQSTVISITDSCHQDAECAFQITNNRFVRCGGRSGLPSLGGGMIRLHCNNPERGYVATLYGNVIDSTRVIYGPATGIEVDGSCRIENTIFGDMLGVNKPQIFHFDYARHDTLILRGNSFSRFHYSIVTDGYTTSHVDARWNWWGDLSGPYHGELNPLGQGCQIDDGIQFNPWLLSDPDTSTHGDTTESVEPEIDLVPEQFSIRTFPNPFNAVTTLVIEVARAGEYEVLLYDVSGRVAANVFSGRIEHSQQVSVDAAGMASGVYFAQLRGADGVLAVGKVLLIR